MKRRSSERIRFREDVWTTDELTAIEKLAALAYEDHVGDDGLDSVWCSRRRLMQRTGLTTDRAQRAIRGLEAKGWLVEISKGSGRRAARYRLVSQVPSVQAEGTLESNPSVPVSRRRVPVSARSVPHTGTDPSSIDPSPLPPDTSRAPAQTCDYCGRSIGLCDSDLTLSPPDRCRRHEET